VVRLLVASNTEVNAKDNHVMTSVHLAAAFGGSVTGCFATLLGSCAALWRVQARKITRFRTSNTEISFR
jgi:hypothetical protein